MGADMFPWFVKSAVSNVTFTMLDVTPVRILPLLQLYDCTCTVQELSKRS